MKKKIKSAGISIIIIVVLLLSILKWSTVYSSV